MGSFFCFFVFVLFLVPYVACVSGLSIHFYTFDSPSFVYTLFLHLETYLAFVGLILLLVNLELKNTFLDKLITVSNVG